MTPKLPTILLVDRQLDMVNAWKKEFRNIDNVHVVHCQDILEYTPHVQVIVSPANSFGVMRGGVDGRYTQLFGPGLEARVRSVIAAKYHGELHVGQACLVPIHKSQQLLCAPTMRISQDVSTTTNAYVAFRAVLQCVLQHKVQGQVLCPGFCTMVGGMSPAKSAKQMRMAYDSVVRPRKTPMDLTEAAKQHRLLL